MLQDAAALAGIETLPWDNWGPALRFGTTRQLAEEQMRDFDALAAIADWHSRAKDAKASPGSR